MFSLIITIIAVALVAALAIATIYYGGTAFSGGSASAAAGALITQGSQITAAGMLYSVEHTGRSPSSIQSIPTQYLRSVPVPPTGAYESGEPLATDWNYYAAGEMHIVVRDKINRITCLAVNKKNGFDGIPATLKSNMIVQCYGESAPYTFYYDPSTATPAQRTQIAEAEGGDGTGYPVLCPDGSSLSSGTCSDAGSSGDSGSGDDSGGGSGSPGFAFSPSSITASYDYDASAGTWTGGTSGSIQITNTGSDAVAIFDVSGGDLILTAIVAHFGPRIKVGIDEGLPDTCSGYVLTPGQSCSVGYVTAPGSRPLGYHNGVNTVAGTIDLLDANWNTLASVPVTITVNASGI